jgi:hypothetical protein
VARGANGAGITPASRWPIGEIHELDLHVTPTVDPEFPAATLSAHSPLTCGSIRAKGWLEGKAGTGCMWSWSADRREAELAKYERTVDVTCVLSGKEKTPADSFMSRLWSHQPNSNSAAFDRRTVERERCESVQRFRVLDEHPHP